MAHPVTRAQKAMQRIGVARGNLAFLGQTDAGRKSAILNRYATWYRITLNSMTTSRSLTDATLTDCAAALVKSLNQLVKDASYIRGFTPLDARRVNPHLAALAADCQAFTPMQASSTEVNTACERFLEQGIGSGSFAGSALQETRAGGAQYANG
jgi:hypothetical protein